MSEEVLRVVHVGTGGRGWWPIQLVAADPHYRSVALVDINPQFLSRARAHNGLGEEVCFSDIKDAVKSVEAEVAIICTPTITHAPFGRVAFEAGMNVLVEKGMTLDWNLAKALVKEAKSANVKFCVSQNYRYFAVESTMKSILGAEEYGEPAFMDLIHHRHRPEPRTLNYPNAMIWDMSCHHFDNLVFWFGAGKTVLAQTFSASWSKYTPHDANVSAIITFKSGVVCTYSLSHNGQNDRHLTFIHTTKGTLRSHDVSGIEFRPTNSKETRAIPLKSMPQSEQSILNDLYKYITEGIEPGISGRSNLQTLALCEATCRASARKSAVEIEELFE